MNIFFLLVGSYLIGSIPFSYIIPRLILGKDIRSLGSGNVGATNVLRTTGRLPGLLALALDFAKGVACVLAARSFGFADPMAALAGFVAMAGHSYPVFLRFRGGKSVATGGGAFLILSPFGIVSSIGVFAVMLLFSRIVSFSSIIAAASFPLFAWFFGAEKGVVLWGTLSAALIIARHQSNIKRLIQGSERKMGEPKHG